MTAIEVLLILLACLMAIRPCPKMGKRPKKPRRPLPRKGPFRTQWNAFKAYRPPRPDFKAKALQRRLELLAEARDNPAEEAFNTLLVDMGYVEDKDYVRQDLVFYPGGYAYPDFHFRSRKVFFECDGLTHAEPGQARHDGGRDRYFLGVGIRTVRISNRTVLSHPDVARAIVLAELE